MTEAPPRIVRPARLSDAEFIGRVQARAFVDLLQAVDPQTSWARQVSPEALTAAWMQTLSEEAVAGRGIIVAQEDATPVGFASYVAGDILALEVDPAFRRQGHGSRLLSALAEEIRPHSEEIRVWLVPEDEARVRFYQSAGFGPAPIRRNLDAGSANLTEHLWSAKLD